MPSKPPEPQLRRLCHESTPRGRRRSFETRLGVGATTAVQGNHRRFLPGNASVAGLRCSTPPDGQPLWQAHWAAATTAPFCEQAQQQPAQGQGSCIHVLGVATPDQALAVAIDSSGKPPICRLTHRRTFQRPARNSKLPSRVGMMRFVFDTDEAREYEPSSCAGRRLGTQAITSGWTHPLYRGGPPPDPDFAQRRRST